MINARASVMRVVGRRQWIDQLFALSELPRNYRAGRCNDGILKDPNDGDCMSKENRLY